MSGELLLLPSRAEPTRPSLAADAGDNNLEALTVAPGVAPWVAGRIGIAGSNEAGLTYTGRGFRLDGRHAFPLGVPTLSVGLGGSALIAQRPGGERSGSPVYGVGFDAPVLLGVQSRSDIYAFWLGPRVGFELLKGKLQGQESTDPSDTRPEPLLDVSGQHLKVGFLVGFRAGFRHLHVALEVGAAYHRANGEVVGKDPNDPAQQSVPEQVSLEQATIAPGGALIITF